MVGAGGAARAAAFAAKKLGFKILYYNRTPEKAHLLRESFGGEVIEGDLGGIDKKVRIVYSSLPAAAEFTVPSSLLHENLIMFDANYKPKNTKMILQGMEAGCEVIRGSEMFYVQGVEQHQLWFKRTAPFGVMQELVMRKCDE